MADLLDLSSEIIDEQRLDLPVNRVTNELSEVANGLAVVESFSHSVVVDTGEGLVAFDSSGGATGAAVVEAIRGWNPTPVRHLVYTHGHADHVGGSGHFAAAFGRPEVTGHRRVLDRLDRYALTSDWNRLINARQFGGTRGDLGFGLDNGAARGSDFNTFLPAETLRPDRIVDDYETLTIGDTVIELRHARGETDDHLWAWLPDRRAIMSGDFLIWNFPNAGNPQKVQRYPDEWAVALREMIAMGPELLLPAHGLPIAGSERIARVLDEVATALEDLVESVVSMMNTGATLDDVIHTEHLPEGTLARPYLRPLYDEPEFVVRNIWRLYGGWWDGAASRLKPAPDRQLAEVVAELAGGVDALIARAHIAVDQGDLRLACHLVDFAAWSAGDDPDVHRERAAVYRLRRSAESSLMAKGIYAAAARESEALLPDEDQRR